MIDGRRFIQHEFDEIWELAMNARSARQRRRRSASAIGERTLNP